jgi:hypothetical protein
MIRRGHLGALRYDQRFRYAQDFDLWFRIRIEHELGNVPSHLLLYRVHPESITFAKREDQMRATYDIFRERLGLDEIDFDEYRALINGSVKVSPLRRARAMRKLARAIRQPYRVFLRDEINYARRWLKNCAYVIKIGLFLNPGPADRIGDQNSLGRCANSRNENSARIRNHSHLQPPSLDR